jgi:HK97 gp10 family phage protein
MPYKVKESVLGTEEVKAALRDLPKKVAKKLQRGGINEGTKLVQRAAKNSAPVRKYISRNLEYNGGLLKKSLYRKVKTYRNSGVIVGVVGARKGFKQVIGTRVRGKNKGSPIYADPTKYLHLVELGTSRRTKATHFLEDALKSNLPQVRDLIAQALAEAVAETGKVA